MEKKQGKTFQNLQDNEALQVFKAGDTLKHFEFPTLTEKRVWTDEDMQEAFDAGNCAGWADCCYEFGKHTAKEPAFEEWIEKYKLTKLK